ncbi:enoyl-CoA hydratase/isomerase family protein [Halovivax sp.]|uniref:enoyl-CoA hydratase/isomerase family protein n=1 Tax=Halovivax sp. TaxID=1935978 RepID=UPI0025C6CD95|nr:enoyl-CoA hydratase [Halovivax sp.]
MTDDAVLLDVDGDVATITLNRPERRNALSEEIGDGLLDALEEVESSDAGAVVIEGAGDAFSAGGDVERMVDGLAGDVPLDDRVRALERSTCETMRRLYRSPLPTIAKIDGPAVGAGANLAIACDLQLASEDASFGFVFRQVGLGVDAGTSFLLPRLVGSNVAKELVFTGDVFGADRARELGLVNHVYPSGELDEETRVVAERIADGPTVALRHTKRLVNEGFENSLEQAMTDEAVAQGIVFQTDDHEEGVTAFVEGRDPEFEGR